MPVLRIYKITILFTFIIDSNPTKFTTISKIEKSIWPRLITYITDPFLIFGMSQSMVSFCALQLELEDKLDSIPDIDFNCNRTIEDLFRDLEISNPVAKHKPNRQDSELYRGTRQMSKIVIETYSEFKGGMTENVKGERQKSSNCSKVCYVKNGILLSAS